MSERHSDRVAAALVAALAFGVYLRTMYPGLVPFGDSPKLQFVGRIWGTPHNPGYPLYIVVSHVFGMLPIGTLAYRINLMSAVFASAAAGVLALAVSRLTGRTWAGVASGLGLAFGREFWSQAIVAEVYALATALLAGVVYFTLRWTDTRRASDLLTAVALSAVAVGNHLTIVMFAPGLVVLVLMTDWRAALHRRIVLACALLIVAGLSQYLLILYLTARHPPYLESSAQNLSQLVSVVSGAEFRNRFGHFGWRELFTSRTAQLLGILRTELTVAGLVAAAIGFVVLLRRRAAVAVGLAVSALCVWSFVLDYDVADPEVFLIPVILVLWVFAGAAAAFALDVAARRAAVLPAIAGPALAIVVGATLYSANVGANDHHHRRFEMALMDGLFRMLPPRAIVVPGTFADELMLDYELYGEKAGADRHIMKRPPAPALLKEAAAEGVPIYAFRQARDELARSGFLFAPVAIDTIPDGTSPVFRVTGTRDCLDIANRGWMTITPLTAPGELAVRVDNYRPFDSDLWIVIGRSRGDVRTSLRATTGPGRPRVETRVYASTEHDALARALAAAGFSGPPPDAPYVEVFHFTVNDNGDFQLATFDFGEPPLVAIIRGTADLNNPKRLTVCSGEAM
jgi:transmembrane protein TMEM260 (protein O-mannosyltransferase)